MKKLLYIIALPVVLLLTACGPHNTLIGKWESEPIMGISNVIEFSGSAMSSTAAMGGMTQEIKVKEYKVEKDKVGAVVVQGDNSVTMWYQIIDADTIAQDLGLMNVRYHRKK